MIVMFLATGRACCSSEWNDKYTGLPDIPGTILVSISCSQSPLSVWIQESFEINLLDSNGRTALEVFRFIMPLHFHLLFHCAAQIAGCYQSQQTSRNHAPQKARRESVF